jgi:hypothetical protein
MPTQLSEARRASIYARLHTPGLSNQEIADAEGISVQYVRKLRRKGLIYGKMWPKPTTSRNALKLTVAAFEVGRNPGSVSHTVS